MKYQIYKLNNDGKVIPHGVGTKSDVINYLFNEIDFISVYQWGEVPDFMADEESQEIYGEAKNVYDAFDGEWHYLNGDYNYRIEKL
jgi:hypothetical protein